jgi:hypothetical protein
MAIDLFAGIPVTDYAAALAWYQRLLGSPATFFPNDIEAVWELVDDVDALLAQIAERGLEPTKRETYSNGVRKAIYRDPDGNEIGFGGLPAQARST